MKQQTKFRLHLLGPFRLYDAAGDRISVRSEKSQAMLALLARAPDRAMSRSELGESLWPNTDAAHQLASLRTELAKLRNAMGANGPLAIKSSGKEIFLAENLFDFAQFESASGSSAKVEFLQGIDIPFASRFESWLREQRRIFEVNQESEDVARRISTSHSTGILNGEDLDPVALVLARPALPRRPSIGLLAVRNMSGARELDLLSGALHEALRAALSQFSSIILIDAAHIEGQKTSPQEAGKMLGVHHILDGSLASDSWGGKRLRMQLIETQAGAIQWSCDHEIEKLETIQSQVELAASIAAQVDGSIETTLRQQASESQADSLNAFGKIWAANNLYREWTPKALSKAQRLLEEALDENPKEAWAAAMSAFLRAQSAALNWTDLDEAERDEVFRLLMVARRHAGNDAIVLGYCAGAMLSLRHELPQADRLIERALMIAPNYVGNYVWGGWIKLSLGNFNQALDYFKTAMRLSPRSAARPLTITGMGICSLGMNSNKQALVLLTEAVQELPDHPLALASAAIASEIDGKTDDAESYWTRALRNGGPDALKRLFARAPGMSGIETAIARLQVGERGSQ